MSKNILYIGGAIILVAVISGIYLFSLGHENLKKVDPDFSVSAEELYSYFSDNETNASQTYINKIIDVTGKVILKETSSEGILTVHLDSNDAFGAVICTFTPANKGSEEFFKIGEEVTIRGVCSGMLMDVLLNNCILIGKTKI